jgi:DNA-directed RNA polymerase specialized sigma24 family protein
VTTERTQEDLDPSLSDEAVDIPDAPLSSIRASEPVTQANVRAILAQPETQQRIRTIVAARLRGGPAAQNVGDIVQNVNVAALSSTSLPRTMATLDGWLAMIAVRSVVNELRKRGVENKWVVRDLEVDELPPGGESEATAIPDWLLMKWLAARVAREPIFQETYEILRHKVETGKTLAEVAAQHGMSESALKSRVHEMRAKYEPEKKRRERMMLFFLLYAVAAIAALVWFLWPSPKPAAPNVGHSSAPLLDWLLGGPNDVGSAPPASSSDARDE